MHIDAKVTVWQRMHLPEDLSEEQLNEIKKAISNSDPLPDWIYETDEYELEVLTHSEDVDYSSCELMDGDKLVHKRKAH